MLPVPPRWKAWVLSTALLQWFRNKWRSLCNVRRNFPKWIWSPRNNLLMVFLVRTFKLRTAAAAWTVETNHLCWITWPIRSAVLLKKTYYFNLSLITTTLRRGNNDLTYDVISTYSGIVYHFFQVNQCVPTLRFRQCYVHDTPERSLSVLQSEWHSQKLI